MMTSLIAQVLGFTWFFVGRIFFQGNSSMADKIMVVVIIYSIPLMLLMVVLLIQGLRATDKTMYWVLSGFGFFAAFLFLITTTSFER